MSRCYGVLWCLFPNIISVMSLYSNFCWVSIASQPLQFVLSILTVNNLCVANFNKSCHLQDSCLYCSIYHLQLSWLLLCVFWFQTVYFFHRNRGQTQSCLDYRPHIGGKLAFISWSIFDRVNSWEIRGILLSESSRHFHQYWKWLWTFWGTTCVSPMPIHWHFLWLIWRLSPNQAYLTCEYLYDQMLDLQPRLDRHIFLV